MAAHVGKRKGTAGAQVKHFRIFMTGFGCLRRNKRDRDQITPSSCVLRKWSTYLFAFWDESPSNTSCTVVVFPYCSLSVSTQPSFRLGLEPPQKIAGVRNWSLCLLCPCASLSSFHFLVLIMNSRALFFPSFLSFYVVAFLFFLSFFLWLGVATWTSTTSWH